MSEVNKKYWLNKLASIESWARGLAEECYKTRKELGDVHSPSPRKGGKVLTMDKRTQVIQRRGKNITKKATVSAAAR